MRVETLDRLRQNLNNAEFTPESVLYIVVTIRKIIEESKEHKKYGLLWFYCSWPVHASMSKNEGQEIVKLMDDICDSDNTATNGTHDELQKTRLGEVIDFRELSRQIESFLLDRNLPNLITISYSNNWLRFLNCYVELVADSKMTIRGSRLKHIDFVTIAINVATLETDYLFNTSWTIHYKDGSTPTDKFNYVILRAEPSKPLTQEYLDELTAGPMKIQHQQPGEHKQMRKKQYLAVEFPVKTITKS